jgi:SAM-dependent methyltransferase
MADAAAPGRSEPAEQLVTGNLYDKYRTGNPLYRRLMAGFLGCARELLREAAPERVLEVGCGPGDLAAQLAGGGAAVLSGSGYVGSDISPTEVATARSGNPGLRFVVASAASLPFPDGAFDGVLACEVLEHLDQPAVALDEIWRVSSRWALVSVPWEPVWRGLNLARGAYWSRLGNTPGHVQHFSRPAVRRLVSARFAIRRERRPFPWTMLLLERRP